MITKVVSGGQTGVDRAALDAAREAGIPCGGWCPRGRRAENGRIPAEYPLRETPSPDYQQRTKRNVMDSDGTLIITRGPLSSGTALTVQFAVEGNKPYLVVDFGVPPAVEDICRWIHQNQIRVLNVAGPRESNSPGIYGSAKELLGKILRQFSAPARR